MRAMALMAGNTDGRARMYAMILNGFGVSDRNGFCASVMRRNSWGVRAGKTGMFAAAQLATAPDGNRKRTPSPVVRPVEADARSGARGLPDPFDRRTCTGMG